MYAAASAGFLTLFIASERANRKNRGDGKHEHLEQFNEWTAAAVDPKALGLMHPFCRLAVVGAQPSLLVLDKALAETDRHTTDRGVMVPKVVAPYEEGAFQGSEPPAPPLAGHDQELLTAVVDRAERVGKEVHTLVVPTNNPLHAILMVARALQVEEVLLRATDDLLVPSVMLGASRAYSAAQQHRRIAEAWEVLHRGNAAPLTVRLISRNREIRLELSGGACVPPDVEAKPHSAEELRAAGRGVRRVLIVCRDGPDGDDLLETALTAFDPAVFLTVATLPALDTQPTNEDRMEHLREHFAELRRGLDFQALKGDLGPALVRLASDGACDLLVLSMPPAATSRTEATGWERYVVAHAPCRLFLAVPAKDDGEES